MNKKKIIPLIVVILVLIISILYFEVFRYFGEDNSKIEGSGTIEVTEIEIGSKMAGRILALPKEEGEKVKKADLIAKIEYDELTAQRLSVIANLKNMEKNLKRVSELFKSGSVSKKDFDNVETAYRVAKANFNLINATIDNAVVLSPIDGIVLEKNLEIGEMAFPGTPILTVADLSRVWIKIYVNEKRIGLVKLGQKANLYVDSFPKKAFKGSVVTISNKAEFTPKTIQTKEERVKLMFAVKILVDNPDYALKPGMPADAEILVEKSK